MKPSVKSPELERLLDKITPNPMGRKLSIQKNVCTWCKCPADQFKDKLSIKEFTISGLCQKCQDKVFG